MEGLNLTPLLVGLGALLAGWLIGFFDSNNRTSKKIKQAELLAEIAAKDARAKVAEAEARLAAGTSQAGGGQPAVLRVWAPDAQVLVELDGEPLSPGALQPQRRKRLIDVLTSLRPWLEPETAETPAARGRSAGPVAAVPPPAPARLGAAADERPAAGLGMVGQIDSILQARIQHTPLARKSIRLQDSPEGGVIVYVGVTKYMNIDAVGDAEIVAAIRAAIAEWESRYTPGL